jgi:hypothetical protein
MAGGGGDGFEVVSWRKCTNESAGSEPSERVENSLSGLLPEDENKETIPG